MSSIHDPTPDAGSTATTVNGVPAYAQGGIGPPPEPGAIVVDGPAMRAAVRRLKARGQVVALAPAPQASVLLSNSGAQVDFLAGRINADDAVSRAAGSVGNCPDNVYTEIQLQVERLRGWTVDIRSGPSFTAPPGRSEQLLTDICSPDGAQPGAQPTPQPSPLDQPIAVTFFPDAFAMTKHEEAFTMRALAPRILTITAARKGKLPWLKFARFGELRSDAGSLRHDNNVVAISGIEGDYDDEQLPLDHARDALANSGVACVIYTSPSHSPDKPRWRVLAPLSQELPPERRAALVDRLNGVLGGALAAESWAISQSFYYGSVNGNPAHRVELVDGVAIDLRPDLDAGAMGRRANGIDRPPRPSGGQPGVHRDASLPPDLAAQMETTTFVDVEKLVARITAKTAFYPALRRRWQGDWEGLRDQSRSAKAFSMLAELQGAGFDLPEAVAALLAHADTAAWATEDRERTGGRQLWRAWCRVRTARPNGPAAPEATAENAQAQHQDQPKELHDRKDDDRAPDAPADTNDDASPTEDNGGTSEITSAGADNDDSIHTEPQASASEEAREHTPSEAGNVIPVDFRRQENDDNGAEPPEEPGEEPYTRPEGITPLGHARELFYYFSKSARKVFALKPEQHRKQPLLGLASYTRFWRKSNFVDPNGDVAWDWASDWMMTACRDIGIFDPDRLRGRGAWIDNGVPVLHVGDGLIINGRKTDLSIPNSQHIYEAAIPFRVSNAGPLSTEDAYKLFALIRRLPWTRPISAYFLAGWIVCGFICGALRWRPAIWICGGAGAGKTFTQTNIMSPMLGRVALQVQSKTTEAGIRQALGCDSRPVIFDEFEAEDMYAATRVQGVLDLMRQSSSDSGGRILKGTGDQKGKAFDIRSTFAFASINSGAQTRADQSRITFLILKEAGIADAAAQEAFRTFAGDAADLITPGPPTVCSHAPCV